MMKLEGKHILIISPEPWGTMRVSKHHYASELVRMGNKVVFLASDGDEYKLKETEEANLWQATYSPFVRGMAYLPSGIRKRLQRKKIEKIQEIAGFAFDVIWSFDSSVFYDLDALPHIPVRICHLVDYNQNYHLKEMAASATHCFGISTPVADRLRQYNQATYKVSHGFRPHGLGASPVPLPGNNSTKSVYIGNLSIPLIDWETILITVKQNPMVDFVFVGPEKGGNLGAGIEDKSKEATRQLANSYFLPPVASDDIQNVLSGADLLMITYRQDDPIQVANPHKVLEYLASGKPIVATYTAEFAHLDDMIVMTDINSDYPAAFSQTVKELEKHNTPERNQKRTDYALTQTYRHKIKEIESLLSQSIAR